MSAITISQSLLASAGPPPVVPSSYLNLVSSLIAAAPSDVNGCGTPGATDMIQKWNELAALVDSNARYGGGGVYGIVNGLAPSGDTTSLVLTIAQGQAMIDGAQQVQSGGATITLPASQATICVWGKPGSDPGDMSLSYTLTTTKPQPNCCLLCTCASGGSGLTSIDTSGVVYFQGGIPIRFTADAGMPTDSPSANLNILTKTLHNTYLWNGTSHKPLGIPFVGADPATPQNGDVWFRTDTLVMKVRTGGATKSSAAYT